MDFALEFIVVGSILIGTLTLCSLVSHLWSKHHPQPKVKSQVMGELFSGFEAEAEEL